MKKEIKITIVLDDDKPNTITRDEKETFVIVTHDFSATLMSTLLKNELIDGSFCGGRGDCGRCRVQFLKGATMPTALERNVMSADELRQGYRLACLARPKDDCVIKLALTGEKNAAIITDMIYVTQEDDQISQHNEGTVKRTTTVLNTGVFDMDETIIAVDLGTTTIAMQLMEIGTGHIIDTYCEMNPQRCYGSDVLSRIKASCEGQREALQQLVVKVLKRGVDRFRMKSCHISCMCIAGNTTMEHLLMGYDVLSLGKSPFTPVELGLQEYQSADWEFPVWVTPGISTFVGGDIVAGLYALNMLPEGTASQVRMLIDLGTNGEMAITDGIEMVVTATAAGPAFEGGAGAGIIGSDMIANVAALLQRGVLDETGLLEEPYFTKGIMVGEPPVHMNNKDIRDLQMAKAAVRAGVEILWKKLGCPEIGRVYLAGGFGYYLDVEAAFQIGLLPEHMRGKVSAAGNTSLAGAYRIGCDLLQKRTEKAILEQRLSSIASINLARQEEFERLYVKHMDLSGGFSV